MTLAPIPFDLAAFWHFLTRWGEIQLLLPLALLAQVFLWRQRPSDVGSGKASVLRRWVWGLGLAIALTAASKLAFFGWGLGVSAWNFTGISGHAMASAAILPGLAWVAARGQPLSTQRLLVGLAFGLAALIAYSRLKVGAHSPSESLSGFLLGGFVSAWSLRGALATAGRGASLPMWVPVGLLVALMVLPVGAPPSRTHDKVIQLALKLSGRHKPFERADLQRALPHRPAQFSAASSSHSRTCSRPAPTVAAS
ncbi:phosphatase PAP2 family protein [Roseateles sp.]|uniref:phosphatase PAP2 family protein n=1 Tax=Roseateles sp. TaxID=1971397 RepID=UPI003BA75178